VRAGTVRVLHERSFVDDATRALRAFRYAARLGFTIEPRTRGLIERDLRYVATIGGERLRRELELTTQERSASTALGAMAHAGVLAAVHPALAWDARRSAALAATREAEPDGVALGFALLAATTDPPAADAIIERLRLTREEAAAVRGVVALRSHEAMLRRPDAKPSGITVLLDRYPAASVRALAATASDAIAGQVALRYLGEWKLVKPILSGEDLIEMGVPEGPQVGRGLQLVRAARLDGWAQDRGDERALVLRFVKSIRDSTAMRGRIDVDIHVN
jgi:tRNA nucleotidyltransferase (CCA-adding enzyme)